MLPTGVSRHATEKMEYVSSDTNVWIDFDTIKRLKLPFKLPYVYLMDSDAVNDELLNPPGLGKKLVRFGLKETQLSEEEFFLTEDFMEKYVKLSRYDCIALAIAKVKKIMLLTGDASLRRTAELENVKVIGTIGILDQLKEGCYIDSNEYAYCIGTLLKYNGGRIRLPEKELKKRLS